MTNASPHGAHKWQTPKARAASGRPAKGRSRRPLVIAILFAMLALGGALVALLFYRQQVPDALLVIARVDQYDDDRLPISPWGDTDRSALKGIIRKEQDVFTSQDRALLLPALKTLGQKQKDQPLIIYLCAYAVGTEDGGVAVLPAKARLDDPRTWLPLPEVLDAVTANPAPHLLLLLDLAQPCTAPHDGLLRNDVVERLKPLLEKAVQDHPKLQVLTSCAAGQVSLSSEELGHTAFAYYVARGLQGHADGCLPGRPPDHLVGVQELQSYVTAQVDRWAAHNRGSRQTPQFFANPADADYGLKTVESPPNDPPTPPAVEYPDFLQRPWKERDRWWKDRVSRTPPPLYRSLQDEALRAEARWRGGEGEADLKAFLDPRVDRFASRRREQKIGPEAAEPLSLAQAQASARGQVATVPLDDAPRDLRELATVYALASPTAAKPNPNEKDTARLGKETEAVRKKYGTTPFDLAWTVWTVAVAERTPQPEQLRCWYGLLAEEGKPPPVYAELRFLKRLLELKVEKPADWPAAAVGKGLELTDWAEKVEAGSPDTQPWLKEAYAQAVQDRRAAEELFFNAPPAKRGDALKALDDAAGRYRELHERLTVLNDGRRLRDEGLVFLSGYASYLEVDDANAKVWEEAVGATRELDDLLGRPAEGGSVPPATLLRLNELVTVLRNNLKKLRQSPDATWVTRPIDPSKPVGGADLMKMSALLQLPSWTLPERLTLWANYRAAGARVAQGLSDDGKSSVALVSNEGAVSRERERALVRARTSTALLKLARSAEAGQVEAELQKLQRARAGTDRAAEEAAWQSLGRALRQAWKQADADRSRSGAN